MACHTTRLELQSMIYEVWPQFLVTALLLRREEEEGFVKIYKCMFLNIKCAPKKKIKKWNSGKSQWLLTNKVAIRSWLQSEENIFKNVDYIIHIAIGIILHTHTLHYFQFKQCEVQRNGQFKLFTKQNR